MKRADAYALTLIGASALLIVTTFSFHSAAAGTYAWQCMDPCGSDPNGWGGAMATAGYMKVSLTSCVGCCC